MTCSIDNLRLLDDYDWLNDECDQLEDMLRNWDRLDPKPNTPKEVISRQLSAMSEFLLILTERIRLYEGMGAFIEEREY